MLWIVAALVVGSVIYLSALERLRDFAVFKAIGVPTRDIAGGLALQAIVVALLAALVGAVLSLALGPLFPMQVIVPGAAFVALPVIAVLIGLIASATGLRRAVSSRSRHSVRRPMTVGDLSIQNSGGRVLERRIRSPAHRRSRPRRPPARWRSCSARAAAGRRRCCHASVASSSPPGPSSSATST